MARLDIDFVLLDETVVDYGWRCLMSGAELDEFIANPVMLFMHLRATSQWENPKEDVLLPIGKWYDIRVEDGRLVAKPEFDDDDDFAQRIEKKVKKGYLNAASVWVKPFVVSDEEKLKIPGQTGPSITKWGVRESSIVDIPGCRNSLAIRKEDGGKLLKLSSQDMSNKGEVLNYLKSLIPNQNHSEMDKKLLCARLGLPDTATDQQIDEKLAAVTGISDKYTKLVGDNAALAQKVKDLEEAADKKKIDDLVDGAIGSGKLAAGDREAYVKLAAADFDTTKKVIDGMKPYQSIEGGLKNTGGQVDKSELDALNKLSGRELYMQGKFERLQALDENAFKLKYKEYFGVEYKA